MLMAYEVTRDMPTQLITDRNAAGDHAVAPVIDGKKTVFVVIMRAGDGFLDGMLEVVPGARVGHIGLYRDPKTLVAVEYYFKMPHDMHDRDAIVLDLMLATGNPAGGGRPVEGDAAQVDPFRQPAGGTRRPGRTPGPPPRRAGVHRRRGPAAERAWYIVPGPGDARDRIFGEVMTAPGRWRPPAGFQACGLG